MFVSMMFTFVVRLQTQSFFPARIIIGPRHQNSNFSTGGDSKHAASSLATEFTRVLTGIIRIASLG